MHLYSLSKLFQPYPYLLSQQTVHLISWHQSLLPISFLINRIKPTYQISTNVVCMSRHYLRFRMFPPLKGCWYWCLVRLSSPSHSTLMAIVWSPRILSSFTCVTLACDDDTSHSTQDLVQPHLVHRHGPGEEELPLQHSVSGTGSQLG